MIKKIKYSDIHARVLEGVICDIDEVLRSTNSDAIVEITIEITMPNRIFT